MHFEISVKSQDCLDNETFKTVMQTIAGTGIRGSKKLVHNCDRSTVKNIQLIEKFVQFPSFYCVETRTRDPTNEFGIEDALFG
jgi:hypothetical protein